MPPDTDSDLAAIAFVFVACAKLADGEFDDAELVRLVERVAGWAPGASRAELRAALGRAVELLTAAPDDRARHELVAASTRSLAERLPAEDRERLITELIGLVSVDGRVEPGETDFVLAVAKLLGVQVERDD